MLHNSEKGQTLIEILIAMSAAVIVLSAITLTVISALSNAQYSKNQNLATQYAQEGMEVVRKIRDNDWNAFAGFSGKYCLSKGSFNLGNSVAVCSQNVDLFVREININPNSADCNSGTQTQVAVSVKWSDGKCPSTNIYCHEASLVSCFTDANLVPTP
ncbi:hypothetical protein C4559_03995 [Candidatus Microgenomates bacterium]|nr:MAG: hypothetical protein C4559_03995 [Candidatus Microgenomates bacterium]